MYKITGNTSSLMATFNFYYSFCYIPSADYYGGRTSFYNPPCQIKFDRNDNFYPISTRFWNAYNK